ncbi:ATP-binding protein [Shewanella sp. CG12_big_fil_rev_8_21_14_0_65_47_15]|uniref:ATP-binding protein n=1 Tax=Shewanella sp. CG12_big_fil_rev_8_21_14_0_65_47_15 TaxID=1975537 RepID=UPI0025FE5686|nr:ATP-binding protein [Shewanella sp. CG12_big_fil_rev_8_21_14_0_65_47_15]
MAKPPRAPPPPYWYPLVPVLQRVLSLRGEYFQQQAGKNRFCVEDDGPGFEGIGKKLMTAFERDAQQSDNSGYGLGLYIVKKIATWHYGKLELNRSEKLGGASLCIIWDDSLSTKIL